MEEIPRDEQLANLERALEHVITGLAEGEISLQQAEMIVRSGEVYVDLINLRDSARALKKKHLAMKGT